MFKVNLKRKPPSTLNQVKGTIELHVTERHIKRGRPGKPKQCPVYLAVRESFSALVLNADDLVNPYMGAWIRRFDARLPVLPFSITLEIITVPSAPAGVFTAERRANG